MDSSFEHIQFVTAREVSVLFRIPLSTVYHLVETGKLRSVRIGKHLRIVRSDVEQICQNALNGRCVS